MKKLTLAAGLAVALGSSAAMAGGIQIQPAGDGTISGSKFLTGLGDGGIGNMLLKDMLISNDPTPGMIYGHTVIDTTSSGSIGGELTIVFNMETSTTPQEVDDGGGLLIKNHNSADLSNPGGHASGFELYWNKTIGDANMMDGSDFNVEDADSVWLASGTVEIDTSTAAGLSKQSGAPDDLADNNATQSDFISGSMRLLINFTSKNDLYVVNKLTTALIDLETTNAVNAPFTAEDSRAGKGYANGAYASTTVNGAGGTSESASFGGDGENDFTCSSSGLANDASEGNCDMQLQMNTTLSFTADRIPEPTGLALLGAGLGLFGIRRARAKRNA